MFRQSVYALIGASTFILTACGGGTEAVDPAAQLAAAPHALADASLCASNTPGYIAANGECGPQFKFPAPQAPTAGAAGPKPQGATPKTPQAALQTPQAATTTLTSDALFTWAGTTYPSLFWGGSTTGSVYVGGYGTFYYRYWYGSGNYLGVLNGYVYVYGPISGYQVSTVGLLSDYTCYVYTCNSTGSLSVGNYTSGGFYSSNGYSDYSIYLYGGTSYTFELDGGTLYDPYLELYDPYSSRVAYNDDINYSGGDLNSRIVYTPGYSGYYTLRASSYTTGYGSFTLSADTTYSGGGGGGGGGGTGYINWTGSVNGTTVLDANGESFAFTASTRCLYSYNTGGVTSNFCLYSNSAEGSFAGQYVQVLSVAAAGGGCLAALADSYGRKIDIYTSGGTQYVSVTNEYWNTSGCTY
jgi:hypothetical protein